MLHGAVCVLWDVWKVQSETLHGAVCVLQMSGRCNDRRCTVVFVCCGYVEGAMTDVARCCLCVVGCVEGAVRDAAQWCLCVVVMWKVQ